MGGEGVRATHHAQSRRARVGSTDVAQARVVLPRVIAACGRAQVSRWARPLEQ